MSVNPKVYRKTPAIVFLYGDFFGGLADTFLFVGGYIMTTFPKLILTSLVIFLLSCNAQTVDSTDKTTTLISKDTTIKNERDNNVSDKNYG